MLETLVPSRIRRTLLEHILAHPDQHFYLRGLAKELTLSISPLRRELKRLEELGMLAAHEEGNLRLYVVNQHCPLFLQLKQAAEPGAATTRAAADVEPMLSSQRMPEPAAAPVAVGERPALSPLVSSGTLSAERIERIRRATRPAVNGASILGAVAITVLLMGGAGVMVFLVADNYRHVVDGRHSLQLTPIASSMSRPSGETAVPAKPPASGEMRSSRWRLTPGAVGGFSTGSNEGAHP